MAKKKILIFIDWYLPGFKAGGPIKSISALISHFKEEYDFLIITTDSDFGESLSYTSVPSDEWVEISDSVKVYYCSKNHLNRKKLLSVVDSINFDKVYLNSFFSFYFSIYPLLLKKKGKLKEPIILAPRGMLGDGALQIKSFKKKTFIFLSKLLSLHKKITWHATSQEECKEIVAVFGTNAKIIIASNLQNKNDSVLIAPPIAQKREGETKLFYLSRISEKKNLLFALDILNQLKTNVKIVFDIIGPVEDAVYWNKCLEKIKKLPASIQVNFVGALPNSQIADKIKDAHFLFLPTLNENYGHVIVESWMNGKPVIISNQTPWRNLKVQNIGWDLSLNNPEKFLSVIIECLAMNQQNYDTVSKTAFDYAIKHIDNPHTIQQNRLLFQ